MKSIILKELLLPTLPFHALQLLINMNASTQNNSSETGVIGITWSSGKPNNNG